MLVLRDYFLLFMLYSFIGWIVEIIDIVISKKTLANRGFLVGPYLPIYGFGSLAIIIFLKKYSGDIITLFCMCAVVCSTLEYFTSLIMEKLFHARWWDYSDEKFNINGRICLETASLFGVGGCLIIYVAQPLLSQFLSLFPSVLLNVIAVVLFIIFLVDVVISFRVIYSFRSITNNLRKDSTAEMRKLVKKTVSSTSILGRRLIKAFPDFTISIRSLQKKAIRKKKKE